MKSFCYSEDRFNSNSGSETMVTARVGVSWIKFKECWEVALLEEDFRCG